MNTFTFTGNLGRDAEVRYTQGGDAVCSFAVAVKSGFGERQKTNWIKCAMFGKKADGKLPQYLIKGTQVAVSGECSLEEWEGQNGKGSAIAVNVREIDLIGSKPQQGAPQGQPQAAPQQPAPRQPEPQQNAYAAAQNNPQPTNAFDDFDDDIPF